MISNATVPFVLVASSKDIRIHVCNSNERLSYRNNFYMILHPSGGSWKTMHGKKQILSQGSLDILRKERLLSERC